ncbi:MAG TPA: hypothetical protein VIV60_19275 [Polyangiaceae bacterium]
MKQASCAVKARAPLLPPFIIEQIRRREDAERLRRDRQPRLELPLDAYRPFPPESDPATNDRSDRGVIILDLMS